MKEIIIVKLQMKLLQIRKATALSQPEFSKLLDISAVAVSFYERGLRIPNGIIMVRYAQIAKEYKIRFEADEIN